MIRNGTSLHCRVLLIAWALLTLALAPNAQSADQNAGDAGIKIILRNAVSGDRPADPAEFADILIVRDRRSIPVVPNMRLRPGDLVSTGNLEAVITFDGDEKELIVGSNSQIDILNPSIRAVIGEVVVKIKTGVTKAATATRDLFRVEGEFVRAAAEGTIFYFRTSAEATEVRVFEGRVRMEPNLNEAESLLLEAGEIATYQPNKTPVKHRMSSDQINEILVKVRRIEHAVPPYSGRQIMPPPEPQPVVPKPPDTPVITASTDRPELVREVKRLLLALGYDPGPLNTNENESTTAAVRAFKQSRNLPGPAQIDEPLARVLRTEKNALDRRQPLPPLDRGSIKGIDAAAGKKVYTKNVMTADELIECIRQDQRAEAGKAALDATMAELDARKKLLENLAEALDQLYKNLDRSDQTAVDSYNARITDYQLLAEKFNTEEIGRHRELLKSYNDALNACEKMCANRQYYIDDYLVARDTLRLKEPHDSRCGI
ncbi:MAG: hypothetical protein C0630_19310 [Sedimenticola selenatireducens]|uniref:Peptidoglycan binding-like domain-containing protein n=1 Tax=Sedimenticola selenatireducens TaxID=191960 RepID=A0A2N6CR83_9GAMM|nr:MAG: hypothetical protein C0630_19310 [Sedimenticola selenatireducens]